MSCPYLSVVTVSAGERAAVAMAEALRAQSLAAERFEWLACLDGDGAAALTALELPFRLRVVEADRPLTVGAARNACARRTCGSILLFSDDDVVPAPGCLAAHVRSQEAGLCVARGKLDAGRGAPRERLVRARRLAANGAEWSVAAVRLRSLGGFDESLAGTDLVEAELEQRMIAAAIPFRTVPGITAWRDVTLSSGTSAAEAREAGESAARLVRARPELAWALGVHPRQLAARRTSFARRWRSNGPGGARVTRDLQRAFAEGAASQMERAARAPRGDRASMEDVT